MRDEQSTMKTGSILPKLNRGCLTGIAPIWFNACTVTNIRFRTMNGNPRLLVDDVLYYLTNGPSCPFGCRALVVDPTPVTVFRVGVPPDFSNCGLQSKE